MFFYKSYSFKWNIIWHPAEQYTNGYPIITSFNNNDWIVIFIILGFITNIWWIIKDKNEALLEQALVDNTAALALKLDTKFFLQYLGNNNINNNKWKLLLIVWLIIIIFLEILCAKGSYQRLIDEVDANIFVYNNKYLYNKQ